MLIIKLTMLYNKWLMYMMYKECLPVYIFWNKFAMSSELQ